MSACAENATPTLIAEAQTCLLADRSKWYATKYHSQKTKKSPREIDDQMMIIESVSEPVTDCRHPQDRNSSGQIQTSSQAPQTEGPLPATLRLHGAGAVAISEKNGPDTPRSQPYLL